MTYLERKASNCLTDAWMEKQAADLGLDIEAADDFTLQLDIDSDAAYATAVRSIELLRSLAKDHVALEILDDAPPVVRLSKNNNRHMTLKLKWPMLPIERIALQAMLGSDPEREIMSLAGLRIGKARPIVLFRPKNG